MTDNQITRLYAGRVGGIELDSRVTRDGRSEGSGQVSNVKARTYCMNPLWTKAPLAIGTASSRASARQIDSPGGARLTKGQELVSIQGWKVVPFVGRLPQQDIDGLNGASLMMSEDTSRLALGLQLGPCRVEIASRLCSTW